MKLYYSQSSPYVKTVLVTAIAAGLADRIACRVVDTTAENADMRAVNPLHRVPTLETDDGRAVYDSPVIAEYLAWTAGREDLVGRSWEERLAIRQLQALGDGIMDAALPRAKERLRAQAAQSVELMAKQGTAIVAGVKALEDRHMAEVTGPDTLGVFSVIAALDYLDLRHGDLEWRQKAPELARWYDGTVARREEHTATRLIDQKATPATFLDWQSRRTRAS